MQHDDLVYVGHMLDVGRKASAKVRGLSRASFDADENVRLAVAHLIQTMGEAGRRVSPAYRAANPGIPWSKIIGMRNKVVHDYLNVDFDIVWGVATVELPPLLAALETLMPPDRR